MRNDEEDELQIEDVKEEEDFWRFMDTGMFNEARSTADKMIRDFGQAIARNYNIGNFNNQRYALIPSDPGDAMFEEDLQTYRYFVQQQNMWFRLAVVAGANRNEQHEYDPNIMYDRYERFGYSTITGEKIDQPTPLQRRIDYDKTLPKIHRFLPNEENSETEEFSEGDDMDLGD